MYAVNRAATRTIQNDFQSPRLSPRTTLARVSTLHQSRCAAEYPCTALVGCSGCHSCWMSSITGRVIPGS